MTMPDTIIGMHVAALPGAVRWDDSDGNPAANVLCVFDGIVPPVPPSRYVVVYADDGTREAGAVCAESTGAAFRWQTTCVAPDRQMAAWLASTIRDALTDARPTSDDWLPGQIEHTFSQLPRRDEQVMDRPVVYAVDTYSLQAERVATGS